MLTRTIAGAGRAVVLFNGYAETGDSWGPLAAELAKSYTPLFDVLFTVCRRRYGLCLNRYL
jgi:hypothetical protein